MHCIESQTSNDAIGFNASTMVLTTMTASRSPACQLLHHDLRAQCARFLFTC